MEHASVPHLFGLLAALFATAAALGSLARRTSQPAVLGELLAGAISGGSVLGVVDAANEVLHLLADLGVVILLCEVGLESDLRRLLRVGGASAVVTVAGVVRPFALGYAVCRLLGLSNLVAIVAGATLTATSVGITARVLSDLGSV